MPIRPFLREQSFAPEAVSAMGIAFERVCADLRLTDKSDRLTEVVAKRIIDLAADGSCSDPDQLHAAAIASFKRGE